MLFIDDIYTLSVSILGFISFVIGVCLLYIKTPQDDSLQHYYLTRKILAFAYFFVSALTLADLLSFNYIDKYTHLFTLTMASFQVVLFSFAVITLINTHFLSRKQLYLHLLPVVVFSVSLLFLYVYATSLLYRVVFFLFLFFYCCQLFFYSYLFHRQYKQYKEQLDNYYSESKKTRLRWIKIAFFTSLCCGIFAFLCTITSRCISTYLTFLIALFYFYFGLRYINYVFIFHTLKPVLETPIVSDVPNRTYNKAVLDQSIQDWIEKKEYLNKTLSIEDVARALQTNRTYLSKYINTEMQINFKTWINDLRIEEAKVLIRKHPEMTIGEIGTQVGFSEKSNFSRQFQKSTGTTPHLYRKNLQ